MNCEIFNYSSKTVTSCSESILDKNYKTYSYRNAQESSSDPLSMRLQRTSYMVHLRLSMNIERIINITIAYKNRMSHTGMTYNKYLHNHNNDYFYYFFDYLLCTKLESLQS
jgi:hypothetical protein